MVTNIRWEGFWSLLLTNLVQIGGRQRKDEIENLRCKLQRSSHHTVVKLVQDTVMFLMGTLCMSPTPILSNLWQHLKNNHVKKMVDIYCK